MTVCQGSDRSAHDSQLVRGQHMTVSQGSAHDSQPVRGQAGQHMTVRGQTGQHMSQGSDWSAHNHCQH